MQLISFLFLSIIYFILWTASRSNFTYTLIEHCFKYNTSDVSTRHTYTSNGGGMSLYNLQYKSNIFTRILIVKASLIKLFQSPNTCAIFNHLLLEFWISRIYPKCRIVIEIIVCLWIHSHRVYWFVSN